LSPASRTDALADPVRQIRGKRHADIDIVTTNGVEQLNRVRIAEQEDPQRSRELWSGLQRKLQQRLGASVRVQARTLTGFEEGLYAWLAVREARADSRFGIAEMGGASAKVSFPCPQCDPTDDAVRTVTVKCQPLRFYSYSFVGLGQDEAPKTLGLADSCRWGAALKRAGWQKSDCAQRIDLSVAKGLKDRYNFDLLRTGNRARGTERSIPTRSADATAWVLTCRWSASGCL
jgi:hypothetical protein